MKRFALALAAALSAQPALAEPYQPLPRYSRDKVRQRATSSRAAQMVHQESPNGTVRAEPVQQAAPVLQATAEEEDEIHVIAIPPLPEKQLAPLRSRRAAPQPRPPAPLAAAARSAEGAAEGSSTEAAAPRPAPSPATPPRPGDTELKVTVAQGRADGRFVMLVEDPSGARIELTLDEGGRLVGVQRAASF